MARLGGGGEANIHDPLGIDLPPEGPPEANLHGLPLDRREKVLSDYGGSAEDFQQDFSDMSPELRQLGLNPTVWAQQHWQDVGKLTRAWADLEEGGETFAEAVARVQWEQPGGFE